MPYLGSPSVECFSPRPNANTRIFCFPYAGGGAGVFRGWSDWVPEHIEVCGIQLPGRWGRFNQPALRSMDHIVQTLGKELQGLLDKPFAFFGHSMGALLAYELSRYLLEKEMPLPSFLALSAYGKPVSAKPESDQSFGLPDEEFIEKVRSYGGVPPELAQNRELLTVFLPTLRADFEVIDTYNPQLGLKLPVPILGFGGSHDHQMSVPSIQAWEEATSSSFEMEVLEGDHFFIKTHGPKIMGKIARKMAL